MLRTRAKDRLLPGRGLRTLWMPVVPVLGPPPGRGPDVDTAALWLEFRGRLRAFVARRISDGADVDDTVQWVFPRLHESQAGLERTDRVHAWLYRTARRAIADGRPRDQVESPR